MGADMIGYLVKGPRKISKEAIKKAVDLVWEEAQERQSSNTIACPDCDALITVDKDYDDLCPECGANVPDLLCDIKTCNDAKTFVKELVAEWPPDYRDVAYRQDPDDPKQLLVFAGEMSWGDTPDGCGYLYLDRLIKSGVSDALGIR